MIVIYGDVFRGHKPTYGHPENPSRVVTAYEALSRYGLLGRVVEPAPAGKTMLYSIHDPDYVGMVEKLCELAPTSIDADTYVSDDTFTVALHAVGAAIKGLELALERGEPVMALVRPPGHHAGRSGRAMGAPTQGFCIFNNVAAAASFLLNRGFKRVLILDFDVHHGNGTQEIFYSDPRVLHIDLHQDPRTLYPGTGFITDVGSGEGEGSKVNVPLPPGSGDDVYSEALDGIVAPLVSEFKPEAVLVSAGFDAYSGDGLAGVRLTSNTYYRLGRMLAELGVKPLLSVLEGGYSKGLQRALPAYASALASRENPVHDAASTSRSAVFREAREAIRNLRSLLRRYWKI